ncbi:MAG: hypothetical protein AB7U83_23030 [Vicinamibacterales bacterium]
MTSIFLVVALAGAQTAATPWQPWLGCWVAEDDRAGTGARTCIAPGADDGVSIVTTVGVQEISRESRVADGRERPVAVDDCRGTERSQWSADGRRVYRATTVACGGEPPRTLASVSFIRDDSTWVDVQTVRQGADTSVRVLRYRPARVPRGQDTLPVAPPAFAPADHRWTVADVLELSASLPPDGVQAAIGEGATAFDLNKRTLTALADAGVAERVIDLMVGLTYPSRFVIQPGGSAGGAGGGGALDPFFAPILGPASLYGCYSPYGWATAGYFSYCGSMSPFLMGYGPAYYYGYYHSSWFITNGAIPPAEGGGPATRSGEGRVVNGRGYTLVAPVDTAAVGGGVWHGQGADSGGSSSGSSSGGSSGVSSGGYSGGGGDGGRMAMPRPPGP